jgi:hypothetical protein
MVLRQNANVALSSFLTKVAESGCKRNAPKQTKETFCLSSLLSDIQKQKRV